MKRSEIILITDNLLEEALAWHFEEDDLSILEVEQCQVGDVIVYDMRRRRRTDWITDLVESRNDGADWEVIPIMLDELIRRRAIAAGVYVVVVPPPEPRDWTKLNPWFT